jgi:RNA recognition motif-containing protein
MNIYVSNLSFNVRDEDLQEYFAEYGEVTSAKVIKDKFTNKSRGFGFVEMPDDESARWRFRRRSQHRRHRGKTAGRTQPGPGPGWWWISEKKQQQFQQKQILSSFSN